MVHFSKAGASIHSNVHHIDEIRDAGLELPSVNQIEVCFTSRYGRKLILRQLHPFCQQRPIVKYCEENGIAVQAYSPLVRGQLDHPVLQRLAKKVPLFYERRHYSGGS